MLRMTSGESMDFLLAVCLFGCQCFSASAELPLITAVFPGTTPGEEREVAGVRLCWCPPGRFLMGSPPNEPGRRADEEQVEVTLTKGYYMGKTEVTLGEWKRICGEFPTGSTLVEGDNFPMNTVSYIEAEGFCRRLTEMGHASGELPKEWEFRLPTEAQWEYACRAGTTTASSFGSQLSFQQANIQGEPYEHASPAGIYPANAWGLQDMHGNVFEWCRDWYHVKLPGGTDPDLSSVKGAINRDGTYSRVRRGGAWNDDRAYCRSAVRLRYEPERRSDHIGFRVVTVKR